MNNETTTHSKLLAALVGLQSLMLITMWMGQTGSGSPSLNSRADAQMPDAGSQRAAMLDELKGIRTEMKLAEADLKGQGARLDKMGTVLESGRLQVRVVSPDENKRPAPAK